MEFSSEIIQMYKTDFRKYQYFRFCDGGGARGGGGGGGGGVVGRGGGVGALKV